MMTIRPAAARGKSQIGWLDSRHTFSFSQYFSPAHMGFRSLRVINDDRVKGGAGFGRHPHRDMEIISWVLEGALTHEDSMGTKAILQAGHVQRMSAGTGIYHSEYNASQTEPVHFLQIWIEPNQMGIEPRFEDLALKSADTAGKLKLIASEDGADGSSVIQQDARIYLSSLTDGDAVSHEMADGRAAWLQVARGSVSVNGTVLQTGDGVAIEDEPALRITGNGDFVLFDLA